MTVIVIFWLIKPYPLKWMLKNYFKNPDTVFEEFLDGDYKTENGFRANIFRVSRNYKVDMEPVIQSTLTENIPTGHVYEPPVKPDPDSDSKSKKVIVWIHGGAFITRHPYINDFLIKMAVVTNRDVWSFDYPEHLSYNQKFAVQSIADILKNKFNEFEDVVLLGDSAGGFYINYLFNYYGDLFDTVKVSKVILIHPFTGHLNNGILSGLFKTYLMRGVKYITKKQIPRPTLLITSPKDLFHKESEERSNYLEPGSSYVSIDCHSCFHDFPFANFNFDVTKTVLDEIKNFCVVEP